MIAEAFFAGVMSVIALILFAGAVWLAVRIKVSPEAETGDPVERPSLFADRPSNVIRWPIVTDAFQFKDEKPIPARRKR